MSNSQMHRDDEERERTELSIHHGGSVEQVCLAQGGDRKETLGAVGVLITSASHGDEPLGTTHSSIPEGAF